LFSTFIRTDHAGVSHSSCVDVTGTSDLREQREPNPGHAKSQLFDQTNNRLTGNPFYAGAIASDDSLAGKN